ncbi:manganese catalase family protein [Sphingomonas morindae]|uniref:Manganese catalase family protein n=1 Tax=Sphingomonas morindae TaxID=1541170 RepID=A0ABY4X3G8_9SPHN|nr:manganese catalase family protein [Sphingomonas morindae]USI71444.1 manganese catalase family protein [Sphingomonas morindae]
MFMHNKRLQYTVRVSEPNPRLACLMLEQFGGADGELAAAMRYFTQGLTEEDPGRKDMLLDIATEELSHLEVIGSIIAMLNKGARAELSEAARSEAELFREIGASGISAKEAILFGGGAALIDSAGAPWSANYIDSRGEPTVDLRSNIAAEARAKIVYERLINITDDPGIKEALGFLMTREVAHQKSFEKALYAIADNFPPGKLPGVEQYASLYVNTSQGEGDLTGPWNSGAQWDRIDDLTETMPIDGGTGIPTVTLSPDQVEVAEQMALRLASVPEDRLTGAEIGAGPGAGRTSTGDKGGAADIAEASSTARAMSF